MIPEIALLYKFLLIATAIPIVDVTIRLTKTRVKLATSKLGSKSDLGRLNGNDGLILSKQCQLSFKKTLEGVCVIAPTGEGKSSSVTIPILLSNDLPKSSIVVADPKGEQYLLSAEYQRSIGRTPILFEPLGNSAKYNPLEQCKDFTEIRDLATNLIMNGDMAMQMATGRNGGSTEWQTMSIPLFIAALLRSKTISEAVKFLVETPSLELVELLAREPNEDIRQQFAIFMSSAESPKTMASIKSTLLSSLQLWTDHNIINSTAKSDFNPSDLRNKPIALYIKYDAFKSNYLSPFLSVFYSQLIEKLMYCKGLPVTFILDEFGNIGRISNFETAVTTGRSEGLSFLICIQDMVRLYEIYGKNKTTTILNCLKTKCVLPSISDYEALTYISNLCDDTEIATESYSGDKVSHSKTTRKLFTPGAIRMLKDDTILIVAHNKYPFLDKQNTYYTQEKYTNNII